MREKGLVTMIDWSLTNIYLKSTIPYRKVSKKMRPLMLSFSQITLSIFPVHLVEGGSMENMRRYLLKMVFLLASEVLAF